MKDLVEIINPYLHPSNFNLYNSSKITYIKKSDNKVGFNNTRSLGSNINAFKTISSIRTFSTNTRIRLSLEKKNTISNNLESNSEFIEFILGHLLGDGNLTFITWK